MSRTSSSRVQRGRWLLRSLVALLILALLVIVIAAYVLSQPQFGAKMDGERLARARANPHFRDGRFVNPLPPAERQFSDTWTLLKGQFTGDEVRVPPKPIPVVPVTRDMLVSKDAGTPPSPGLRAFWIGHGGVYVEIDGVRMLVDPVFSEYASPFEYGPRRFHPPPIALEALPSIDAVLITHDHYDHLDMRTVQHLAKNGTVFHVPLGIGAHLVRWGIPEAQVRDMEWGQEHAVKGVRVVSTPSRHYSGRGLSDRNATLWSSWTVLGAKHRFHVSGDTGYSDHFRAIGDKFGPFDLAFIKIGAYGPGAPWLDIHMDAEHAVRAAGDVKAKRMFPVHWATFNLAFHDWDEPIKRALAAARAGNVALLTPRVGEMVNADEPFAGGAWWDAVK